MVQRVKQHSFDKMIGPSEGPIILSNECSTEALENVKSLVSCLYVNNIDTIHVKLFQHKYNRLRPPNVERPSIYRAIDVNPSILFSSHNMCVFTRYYL